MYEKKERKAIERFIFENVQSGYNCILIGEYHGGQQGLPALNNIAPQLQSYAIEHGVQFVIFNETNDFAADEIIAIPNSPNPNADPDTNAKIENLQQHGILTYGLENQKSSRQKELYSSLDNAFNFLTEHNLLKSFIDTTYNIKDPSQTVPENLDDALREIHLKFFQGDEKLLQQAIQGYYGGSDYRIMWANEAWCNYIKQIPDNIICLVTVGSAHIPCATRGDTIISGMQELLSQKKKTISTFIVESNDKSTFAPYVPQDNNLNYSAIENVSCSVILLEDILRKIDHKILILDQKNYWFNNIKNDISALKELKHKINENAKSNLKMYFRDFLNNFLNEKKI